MTRLPSNAQVADFLAEKQRLVRRGQLSEATREQYAFVMERIWLPWCGANRIEEAGDCTDAVLERFTDDLASRCNLTAKKVEKPLSIATVRSYVRSVRIFLKWAKVPKGDYKPPKQPRRIVDVLTRQEIDRMERTAKDERDRLIVRVLADTGVRVGELIGLRRADLRANTHDRRYFIRVIGKGDKEREVGIPQATFARLKSFSDRNEGERVFGPRFGNGELTRHGVEKMIRHLGVQAKIGKRVYPHLLRHGYATNAIAKGVNLVVLQKTLGHSSLAMLSTTYAHVTADDSYGVLMDALR